MGDSRSCICRNVFLYFLNNRPETWYYWLGSDLWDGSIIAVSSWYFHFCAIQKDYKTGKWNFEHSLSLFQFPPCLALSQLFFLYIFVNIKQHFTAKNVGFSGIQTRIFRVEEMHADHYTTPILVLFLSYLHFLPFFLFLCCLSSLSFLFLCLDVLSILISSPVFFSQLFLHTVSPNQWTDLANFHHFGEIW